MASNPVFDRIEKDARGTPGSASSGRPHQPPGARGVRTGEQRPARADVEQPAAGPVQTGRVTIDDVVMKTLRLLVVLVLAAVGW